MTTDTCTLEVGEDKENDMRRDTSTTETTDWHDTDTTETRMTNDNKTGTTRHAMKVREVTQHNQHRLELTSNSRSHLPT